MNFERIQKELGKRKDMIKIYAKEFNKKAFPTSISDNFQKNFAINKLSMQYTMLFYNYFQKFNAMLTVS